MTQVGIKGPYQDSAYAVYVQGLSHDPVDGETRYFGMLPRIPNATAANNKIYIRASGMIRRVEIYCFSATASGTNEAWSLYIRVNNTTDYLIKTLSVNTSERVFSNVNLAIALIDGDFFEIKMVNPVWITNPQATYFGGYVYIE